MRPLGAWRGAKLAALIAGFVACSDPNTVDECSGNVTLDVTVGVTPFFRWAPDCALSTLVVVNDVEEVMWNIGAPSGENSLTTGIRYGVLPSGAIEEVGPAVPLRSGRAYIVRVLRIERRQDESVLMLAAEEVFRP